jgi:hypothetical protein
MCVPTHAVAVEHSGGQDIDHVWRSDMIMPTQTVRARCLTPSDGTPNTISQVDEPSSGTSPPRPTLGPAFGRFLCLARRQAQPSSEFSASPELSLGHRLRRESRRQPLRPTVVHVEGRLD